MLRALRYLLLGLLAVVLLAVAGSNREPVTVHLMPPEMAAFFGGGWSITLPLFLVVAGGILGGLALGFLWEWVRGSKVRNEVGMHRRRAQTLEREVTRLKGSAGTGHDEVLSLLDSRTR